MRPLRIIDTGLCSARWNTAVSAALLMAHADGGNDVLRFYRFERSILLGASQDAAIAADLGYCRANDIEIARRVTGGGAVYMGPGMLAWDFVSRSDAPMHAVSERIGMALVQGLADVGIKAFFSPPGAVMIGGRKIAGMAATSISTSNLHQGTLIVQDSAKEMACALGTPFEFLRGAVSSLEENGSPLSPEVARAAMTRAFADTFNLSPLASELTERESEIARHEFELEIGTDAFALGERLLLNAGSDA